MQSLKGDKSLEPTQPAVISVDPRSLKPKNITRAHHIMYNSKKAIVTTGDQKPVAAVSKLAGLLGKKGASPPLPPPKMPAAPKIDTSKLGKKISSPSCSTSKPPVKVQKPNVDLTALSTPTLGKFGSINLGDLGRRKAFGGNNKQNAKVRYLPGFKYRFYKSSNISWQPCNLLSRKVHWRRRTQIWLKKQLPKLKLMQA